LLPDYDPHVVEKQERQHPPCLPLSYVLRFITDAARRDVPDVKPKIKQMTKEAAATHPNSSPTGEQPYTVIF